MPAVLKSSRSKLSNAIGPVECGNNFFTKLTFMLNQPRPVLAVWRQ